LHGLELGVGEGADQQPERHSKLCVGDRQQRDQDGTVWGVQSEQFEADQTDSRCLGGGEQAEGNCVAGE